MARYLWGVLTLIALIAGPATSVFAQSSPSLEGVVKDSSGAVLPGVTVEASSPALTEKLRTATSDGSGIYRIVDLVPGIYSVTFSLPGFSGFKREGIQLAGSFTATVNAEMKVGAQEETVTVTGAAPIVDVQSVARQRVMSADVIAAVPTGRNYTALGVLVPGITSVCVQTCSSGSQDVGGVTGDSNATLTVHGSRFVDQRMAINGMVIAGSTGGLTMTGPNMEAMQEVQFDTTSGDALMSTGGVRINLVPKDGSNMFAGGLFVSGTNHHFQGHNVTSALTDRGLTAGGISRVKSLYDVAPTFGGPIKQDKIWFFANARFENNHNYVGNLFANQNAGNPNAHVYVADTTKQVVSNNPLHPAGIRLTWQASPKNKIAVSGDFRDRCVCPNVAGGNTSLEATTDFIFRPDNIILASWSSPVTNRLLLQATIVSLPLAWGNRTNQYNPAGFIQHVEQSPAPGTPANYFGKTGFSWTQYPYWNTGFTATEVTGAHAFKAGFSLNWGYADTHFNSTSPIVSYQLNKGTLNQFTVNTDPREIYVKQNRETGIFLQDKWTLKRLTLSGGLRYDDVYDNAPPVTLGPAPLQPNRNYTFPATKFRAVHDLSPRLGAAFDVFGTGKTAVKVSLNRYVADVSLQSGTSAAVLIGDPQVYWQYTASRSWTDSNGNFYPDCDWSNPALQNLASVGGDVCGAFTGANANFGTNAPGTVAARDVTFGWGHRGYNWEFGTSVQQELVANKVALDVGFFRRWYGNFTVTDNLNVSASDYGTFSVLVPTNPGLPLSGQTITGFLDPNSNVASLPQNNVVERTSHYGQQYENWQGVDFNVSARLGGGTLVQGGFNTGRTIQDNCGLLQQVPESGITTQQALSSALLPINGPLANPFCHQETPYLTQVKILGTYTIPRVNVQLSSTFQSVPGPMISASLVVPNTTVSSSLQRNLSGNAQNVTVQIIQPGSLYGDRLNQLDVRLGKTFRFGGNRVMTPSIDVYNVFNSNAVLAEATTYTQFRVPTSVVGARLLRFTAVIRF